MLGFFTILSRSCHRACHRLHDNMLHAASFCGGDDTADLEHRVSRGLPALTPSSATLSPSVTLVVPLIRYLSQPRDVVAIIVRRARSGGPRAPADDQRSPPRPRSRVCAPYDSPDMASAISRAYIRQDGPHGSCAVPTNLSPALAGRSGASPSMSSNPTIQRNASWMV